MLFAVAELLVTLCFGPGCFNTQISPLVTAVLIRGRENCMTGGVRVACESGLIMAEGRRHHENESDASQETDGAKRIPRPAKRSSFLYRLDASPLLATLQTAAIKHPSIIPPAGTE